MNTVVTGRSPAVDPVCGMPVEETSAAPRTTYEGQPYFFCSPHCLELFEAAPGRYVKASTAQAHSPSAQAGQPMQAASGKERAGLAKDPVCGMMVDKATALHSERGGRTYYFCSTN
ncbi:YHS domain-containing protein, partial [Azotobacter chroococcum]|nr:YHS domain-containing protein [Azotobacter chroococcum]